MDGFGESGGERGVPVANLSNVWISQDSKSFSA